MLTGGWLSIALATAPCSIKLCPELSGVTGMIENFRQTLTCRISTCNALSFTRSRLRRDVAVHLFVRQLLVIDFLDCVLRERVYWFVSNKVLLDHDVKRYNRFVVQR